MSTSTTPASALATRVLFTRLGSNGAKLFFSLAVGVHTPAGPVYATIIRDLVLRESAKGDYVAFPSKPRLKKTTKDGLSQHFAQDVKDGKPVYDSIVDMYFEGQGDERKPTEAAWDFRKQVIAQAVEAYNQLAAGETGRGAAAPANVPTSTRSAEAPAPSRRGSLFQESDDDEIPF